MYLPRRIMQRICIFTSILVFFLIDMLYRECIFNVFLYFFVFFTRDNIAKEKRVCMLLSKQKKTQKLVCIFLQRQGNAYVYCTLQAPEANVPMYFATNTENYRKRNKILRNFCSLKQEFWVRSRTARCCNFFPPFFHSWRYVRREIHMHVQCLP